MRTRTLLVPVLLLVLVLALARGALSPEPQTGPTPRAVDPCGALPPADPSARLPEGFPPVAGQVLHRTEPGPGGPTVHAHVLGEDFAGLRDRLADDLEAAGYRVGSAEQGAADARLEASGPQSVTVRVSRRCAGVLDVRYELQG